MTLDNIEILKNLAERLARVEKEMVAGGDAAVRYPREVSESFSLTEVSSTISTPTKYAVSDTFSLSELVMDVDEGSPRIGNGPLSDPATGVAGIKLEG